MSILQDFENIKKDMIGEEKYNAIEEYLKIKCPQEKLDKYFSEMKNIWKLSPDKYDDEIKKLKDKYNIILLDDIIYKSDEWENFEIWYNENYLKRKVEIKDIWHTDYDDIRCHAILYENDIVVGSIIASEDQREFNDEEVDDQDIEFNLDFFKSKFKYLIYNSFDNYKTLPKISKCSKLLQDIYDDVCSSDSTMCHISDDDWENYYTDGYSDKDIKILEKEIKKYKLDNIITIDEDNYKIIGYGNLEIMFNDDRVIDNSYDNNAKKIDFNELDPSEKFNMEYVGGNQWVIFGKFINGNYFTLSDEFLSIYDDDFYNKSYLNENIDDSDFHTEHLIDQYKFDTKEYSYLLNKMYEMCDEDMKKVNLFYCLEKDNECEL